MRVRQSKLVPTPAVAIVLVNVIDTASAIQSTWRSIGSRTRHTSAGVAAIVMPTRRFTRRAGARPRSRAATGLTHTPVPISKPP